MNYDEATTLLFVGIYISYYIWAQLLILLFVTLKACFQKSRGKYIFIGRLKDRQCVCAYKRKGCVVIIGPKGDTVER